MGKQVNILIVGVGGQGTLLASKIISGVARLSGYDVKQSEVHGMAQRGGSVVTYVRFADKVFSPLIEKGQADMILAFEKLEALRWSVYLKPEGTMIVNTQEIAPMPVILGAAAYPENIVETLSQRYKTIPVQAREMAGELGEPRTVNTILLGVAARILEFEQNLCLQAVEQAVPEKALAINRQAFLAGWDMHLSV